MSSAAGAAPAQAHRYENLGDDDDDDDDDDDAPCPGTVDGDWPHHACTSADPLAPAAWLVVDPIHFLLPSLNQLIPFRIGLAKKQF